MTGNSISKPTHSPKGPYESRVDHCGQSWFELWLPTTSLDALGESIHEDLQSLELRFEAFVTANSRRRDQKSSRSDDKRS